MKVSELKEKLTELDVEFSEKAKKAELEVLLAKAQEVPEGVNESVEETPEEEDPEGVETEEKEEKEEDPYAGKLIGVHSVKILSSSELYLGPAKLKFHKLVLADGTTTVLSPKDIEAQLVK